MISHPARPHRPTSELRDPVLVFVRLRDLQDTRQPPIGIWAFAGGVLPHRQVPRVQGRPAPQKTVGTSPCPFVCRSVILVGTNSWCCQSLRGSWRRRIQKLFTSGGPYVLGRRRSIRYVVLPGTVLTRRRPRSSTSPCRKPSSSRTPCRSASRDRTPGPTCARRRSSQPVCFSSPVSSRRIP